MNWVKQNIIYKIELHTVLSMFNFKALNKDALRIVNSTHIMQYNAVQSCHT